MTHELVPPVKGIANAFHRGTVLTSRICKAAQNGPARNVLDTLEPARMLERSLVHSELRIKDAYGQSTTAIGRRYGAAVVDDHITTGRLHALTINLLEQLNSLDEYVDDPVAFDIGSLTYIQRESERCCDQAIMALGDLHTKLLASGSQRAQAAQDDRSQLPSARQTTAPRDREISQVSSSTNDSTQGLGIQLSKEETKSGRIGSPLQHEGRVSPVKSTNGSTQHEHLQMPPSKLRNYNEVSREPDRSVHHSNMPGHDRSNSQVSTESPHSTDLSSRPEQFGSNNQVSMQSPRSIDLSAMPEPLKMTTVKIGEEGENTGPRLILRDEVVAQMNNVEEWLQRRERERQSFHEDLRRLSSASTSAMSASPRPNNAASPSIVSTPAFLETPDPSPRPESTMLTTIMENMNKPGPPVPPKDDPWDSPTIPAAQDPVKREVVKPPPNPEFPDKRIFNPLDTPPSSQEPELKIGDARLIPSAQKSRAPGYGENVPDGLEVVGQTLICDPGLMLANETQTNMTGNVLSPPSSFQSMDHALTPDTSFYKYGGFCDGAKMVLKGVGGVLQEKKKPGGLYIDVMVMRCGSCSFEMGYNKFYRDKRLEPAGITTIPEIDDMRYRPRFETKSHVKTKLSDQPVYGCIFCIEEGRTVEAQDATVFFTVPQLLRHIQKHPRPLKEVDGVKVVYGPQPESNVDFDLHFLTMEAKISPTAEIATKLNASANGFAIVNHREGFKGFKFIDPDRRPCLQFAIGAKIVGITYPPRFNGAWANGYHDSVQGHFPATAIQLDSPSKDDVTMNMRSNLAATARWDHKPDKSQVGWLSFCKKEKITNIGYPYQDFWCWSGKNTKNQWGLFPKDFVVDLIDTSGMLPPVRSVTSTGIGFGMRNGFGASLEILSNPASPTSPQVSPGGEDVPRPMMNRTPTSPHPGDPFPLPKMKRRLGGSLTSKVFRRSATVKSQASTISSGSSGSAGSASNTPIIGHATLSPGAMSTGTRSGSPGGINGEGYASSTLSGGSGGYFHAD